MIEFMRDITDSALRHAQEACRQYELNVNDETREAYLDARQEYRKWIVYELHRQMKIATEAYSEAARDAVKAYEDIAQVQAWFNSTGLESNLSRTFLKSVCLPSPKTGQTDNMCPTDIKPKGLWATLTRDEMAVWDDHFRFHDDHDYLAIEPPVANY